MASRLLLDAGIFVALINRRDQHRAWVRQEFRRLEGTALVTCDAALSEALFLVRRAFGSAEPFTRLLASLDVALLPVTLGRVLALLDTYPHRMSYADASLVVLAEALDEARVFTVDRTDFSIYRMSDGRPVPALMPPY